MAVQENYPAEASPSSRNILILGKTGVGKASIANSILGRDEFEIGDSIQSLTRQTNELLRFYDGEASEPTMTFKIALVDTVGVSDATFSHCEIEKRLEDALRSFDSLNLIIFVFKFERLTTQERESFTVAQSFLEPQGFSSITALVVTCCEQKNENARAEIKEDLRRNIGDLFHFAKRGVHLVGLPKLSEIPSAIKEFTAEWKKHDQLKLKEMVDDASTCEPSKYSKQQPYACLIS